MHFTIYWTRLVFDEWGSRLFFATFPVLQFSLSLFDYLCMLFLLIVLTHIIDSFVIHNRVHNELDDVFCPWYAFFCTGKPFFLSGILSRSFACIFVSGTSIKVGFSHVDAESDLYKVNWNLITSGIMPSSSAHERRIYPQYCLQTQKRVCWY